MLVEAAAGNPSGCDATIADPGGEALLDLMSSEEVEGEAEGDVDDDWAWRDMRRLSFVVFSSEIRRLNSETTVWQQNKQVIRMRTHALSKCPFTPRPRLAHLVLALGSGEEGENALVLARCEVGRVGRHPAVEKLQKSSLQHVVGGWVGGWVVLC